MDVHARTEQRLVPYRMGLLDDDAHREVAAHLAACEACTALEHEVAETLREISGTDRHLPAAMLAAWPFAVISLAGVERRAVSRHLSRCAECRDDLRRLGHAPVLADTSRIEAAAAAHEPGWLERALGALALLRLEPLPVHVPRGQPQDAAEGELWEGLDCYAAHDYARATPHLERAAAASPDAPEPHIYGGSVELLMGRPEAAIPALERALAAAPAGTRAESESLWQLAHALIADGRAAEATSHLERLAATPGVEHGTEARAMLGEIRRLGLAPETET